MSSSPYDQPHRYTPGGYAHRALRDPSAIGEGGMGEAWRARDPRLGREVVLKTLPPLLANDAERASKKLFDWRRPAPNVSGRPYDVAPDGRFLVTEAAETISDRETDVSVILNWRSTVPKSAGQ